MTKSKESSRKTWYQARSDEQVYAVANLLLEELGRAVDPSANGQTGTSAPPGRPKGRKRTKPAGPVDRVVERLADWPGLEGCRREQVYPLLWEAVRRGFVAINPPRHLRLEADLARRYGAGQNQVRVVPVRGPSAITHVAMAGANLLAGLIAEVWREKTAGGGAEHARVHIALGAGTTSELLARHLALLLQAHAEVPPLTIHALTSGFRVEDPGTAPVTFFHLFDPQRLDVRYVGLFSEAVVESANYEVVKNAIGVRESFRLRDEIDIVITSLASREDPHGMLNQLLDSYRALNPEAHRRMIEMLDEQRWCGDVQYLSYSPKGPINQLQGIRAVTLFEIPDLVEMVNRGRRVVLLSGPCGKCGRSRSDALRPLLEVPTLRVWSHLVCDLTTAERL